MTEGLTLLAKPSCQCINHTEREFVQLLQVLHTFTVNATGDVQEFVQKKNILLCLSVKYGAAAKSLLA